MPSSPVAPATKPGSAAQAARVPALSLDDVCGTVLTSAQANNLPVPFFADLIWQESRLRGDALSPKGAMGIAQIMPEVAAKSGVTNPFDPSQALPASAKLLRGLFDQFRNLGYVAAAYNAGPHRVHDWLEHGRVLPRETRDYVRTITGRPVEAWRKKPQDNAQDDADLRFTPQLPCRSLPAFAALEQTQIQRQAQLAALDRAQIEQPRAKPALSQPVTLAHRATAVRTAAAARPQKVAAVNAPRVNHVRLAQEVRPAKPIRHAAVRTAERERPRVSQHRA